MMCIDTQTPAEVAEPCVRHSSEIHSKQLIHLPGPP